MEKVKGFWIRRRTVRCLLDAILRLPQKLAAPALGFLLAALAGVLLLCPSPSLAAGEGAPSSQSRISALLSGEDEKGAAPQAALRPEIRVRVTSARHTVISSQLPGVVAQVAVRDGDRFEKDQVLIALESSALEIELKRAKANLRRQELILKMTREQVQYQAKGELELDIAKADLAQAAAEVELITSHMDKARIRVPFAGRVGAVAVKELQFITEGQPLLEIIDESAMELEFIVSSQWLPWFKPGYAFSVGIDETGRKYQAVLERLGGKVDPLSRSVNAYARLLEPDTELMEGMSGEAFITPPDTAAALSGRAGASAS